MILIDMEMPKECMGCMFAECDSFGLTGCCSATNDSPLIEFHKHKRMEWCPLRELREERKDNHPLDGMFYDAFEALDKMEKSMSTES